MGRSNRAKPQRLAEKLLQIRKSLNLSQNEMLARLEHNDAHTRSNISVFERGVREPSLIMLLSYARVARVSTDILIDDKLDLPNRLLK
jgi:transcriptional regulator with XRE-family HTH domain